jgi:hypothetical protein
MSKKILILDDEPWQVSWIKPIANSFGWDAYYADSFESAKTQFDMLKPDIVVVDVRIGEDAPPVKGASLEGVDSSWIGLRFVRHLRVEKSSKIRIFVYSGIDREDLRNTVENAFGSKFCSKFDSAYLEKLLILEFSK